VVDLLPFFFIFFMNRLDVIDLPAVIIGAPGPAGDGGDGGGKESPFLKINSLH
jgi:hypothetical protein